MTLWEHLRELRYRLVIIALAIIVGTIVAYIFQNQLFDVLMRPYYIASANLQSSHSHLHLQPVIEGATSPLTLILKVSFVAGLVVTSPITLYQIWAFIVPGLLSREKKWALIFVGAAAPLFLLGVGLGYYIIPKGVTVLIGLTPGSGTIENLLDVNTFLSFLIRVMLVFGAGFLVPVFVLALNFMGIVSGKQLAKARNFVIFGCFVFGAVATPTTDPISMCLLAIPMALLYVAAEIIAHIHDRSLRRRGIEPGFLRRAGNVESDKALAALEGRDLEAEKAADKPTLADLLGLDKKDNG